MSCNINATRDSNSYSNWFEDATFHIDSNGLSIENINVGDPDFNGLYWSTTDVPLYSSLPADATQIARNGTTGSVSEITTSGTYYLYCYFDEISEKVTLVVTDAPAVTPETAIIYFANQISLPIPAFDDTSPIRKAEYDAAIAAIIARLNTLESTN